MGQSIQLPDFNTTEHRPWPCPTGQWMLKQQWYDLAFIHWPIETEQLRSQIPAGLEIDTFDGQAWVSVVPFKMRIGHRLFGGMPTASHFPELNVRTYVRHEDKPGVWFFSLDATSLLAVWGARWLFHLPYFHARIEVKPWSETISYRSTRIEKPAAEFSADYTPTGPVFQAEPGTLEHWLAERYCLYCQSGNDTGKGRIYRGDIHHGPWPLQSAEVQIRANTLLESHGLAADDTAPLVQFAKSIDVVAWPLVAV